MDTDRTTYEKAVRDHLARRRQAVPIVPRDALSPLAEGQNRTADTMIFSHVLMPIRTDQTALLQADPDHT